MIYPDYYVETCISKFQNTAEFFFTQIWKTKMLHLQKHSNPFLISANTPMTIKPKHCSVFSIDHFESNFVNPDKYRSENKPKKHIKNRKSENQTLSESEITSNSSLSPGDSSNSLSGNAFVTKSACWYCDATLIISISFLSTSCLRK